MATEKYDTPESLEMKEWIESVLNRPLKWGDIHTYADTDVKDYRLLESVPGNSMLLRLKAYPDVTISAREFHVMSGSTFTNWYKRNTEGRRPMPIKSKIGFDPGTPIRFYETGHGILKLPFRVYFPEVDAFLEGRCTIYGEQSSEPIGTIVGTVHLDYTQNDELYLELSSLSSQNKLLGAVVGITNIEYSKDAPMYEFNGEGVVKEYDVNMEILSEVGWDGRTVMRPATKHPRIVLHIKGQLALRETPSI